MLDLQNNGAGDGSGSGDFIIGYGQNVEFRFRVGCKGDFWTSDGYYTASQDFAELLPAVNGLEPGDVLVIGLDGMSPALRRLIRPAWWGYILPNLALLAANRRKARRWRRRPWRFWGRTRQSLSRKRANPAWRLAGECVSLGLRHASRFKSRPGYGDRQSLSGAGCRTGRHLSPCQSPIRGNYEETHRFDVIYYHLPAVSGTVWALAEQPRPGSSLRVEGKASGGGHHLTSLNWQVSGIARAGDYQISGLNSGAGSGVSCCCQYLPCIQR